MMTWYDVIMNSNSGEARWSRLGDPLSKTKLETSSNVIYILLYILWMIFLLTPLKSICCSTQVGHRSKLEASLHGAHSRCAQRSSVPSSPGKNGKQTPELVTKILDRPQRAQTDAKEPWRMGWGGRGCDLGPSGKPGGRHGGRGVWNLCSFVFGICSSAYVIVLWKHMLLHSQLINMIQKCISIPKHTLRTHVCYRMSSLLS